MKERRSVQRSALKPGLDPPKSVTCKVVVVGDSQSGKTALLHVFAKDCFPESYVPTVFENYTASFEIDMQRIELSLWDTSGSPYYDNVRPLSSPDSDAVLVCFDISRPETLDSVLKKASQVPPNLRSSPSGGLLLAHGTADANVHFQHSAKLIKRLIRIGANYSMQIYPDEGHFLSPGSQLQLTQCLIGYFKGCLLDSSP